MKVTFCRRGLRQKFTVIESKIGPVATLGRFKSGSSCRFTTVTSYEFAIKAVCKIIIDMPTKNCEFAIFCIKKWFAQFKWKRIFL